MHTFLKESCTQAPAKAPAAPMKRPASAKAPAAPEEKLAEILDDGEPSVPALGVHLRDRNKAQWLQKMTKCGKIAKDLVTP